MIGRRTLLAVAPALALARPAWARFVDTASQTPLGRGALLGFACLDMETGHVSAVNQDLRLPMCSTFKWLLAAMVLERCQANRESLAAEVEFGPDTLLPYAPRTRAALTAAGGTRAHMKIGELCQAAVEVSDNTAANLLLTRVGGPAALTAWLRAHGDGVTRLDRTEPDLNQALPNDPRDTTTPAAMLGDLKRLLFTDQVLWASSRYRLSAWMLACETGPARLKAAIPPGWRIAHKTGTGDRGASGDLGVLLPPKGKPILIAAYTVGSTRPQADIDRWFAGLAKPEIDDVQSYRVPGLHPPHG